MTKPFILKQHKYVGFLLCAALFLAVQGREIPPPKSEKGDVVKRMDLSLSAFGVEPDKFPNINAVVDLQSDTSYCQVSYYDPKFEGSAYRLTKGAMDSIRLLSTRSNVKRLKPKYEVSSTDQPTSTATFYFSDTTIRIVDYGLAGPSPLKELYELVYKVK